MIEIKRDIYLQRLVKRIGNGRAKVITGIRRCGKSYLLFTLFRKYLLSNGVDGNHIIAFALDDDENEHLLDRHALGMEIRSRIKDEKTYYVFLDEIQNVEGFEMVINGLLHKPNIDVYVTGSNSRFLSSDIITEFRGRGDEIRIRPQSGRFTIQTTQHGMITSTMEDSLPYMPKEWTMNRRYLSSNMSLEQSISRTLWKETS